MLAACREWTIFLLLGVFINFIPRISLGISRACPMLPFLAKRRVEDSPQSDRHEIRCRVYARSKRSTLYRDIGEREALDDRKSIEGDKFNHAISRSRETIASVM